MRLGVHGFHIGVRHHEHLRLLPRLRIGRIFQMDGLHGHAAFHERESLAVEVRKLRIVVPLVPDAPLEHQRIAHQHADTVRTGDFVVRNRHAPQRVDHHLHLRRVVARYALPLAGHGIQEKPLVNAVGPRHHLVIGNAGIEQLRGKGRLVVDPVIGPVARPVLDGVGQEEELAARRLGHRLHGTVLQIGVLEDTLPAHPVETGRRTRSSGPHLCDIAVDARQRGETRFGAYDLPRRIIDQRMGRHVTADLHPLLPSVLLGERKDFVQRVVIEVVFQLVRKVGVFRRFVLGTPVETVILLPFALERLAVTRSGPEFGFFEIDRIDPGVDHPTDMHLLHVGDKRLRRHEIGHHVPVPERIPRLYDLPFVQMVHPVPFARKIILVASPCDAGHKMGLISLRPPRLHALLERHAGSVVRIIDNGHIGAAVRHGFPWAVGLERRFLAVGVARAGRCGTPCQQASRRQHRNRQIQVHHFLFSVKNKMPGKFRASPVSAPA